MKIDTVGVPGLVIRPYAGEADLAEMVRIQNAEWEADGLSYRETVAEQVAWFGHASAQFDPARDVSIAEVEGRMVGHARRDWVDATDGVREYRGRGAVDPGWRRRGIGRALAEDGERRALALAAAHETDRPRVFGVFTEGCNAGANALVEAMGYRAVRWFFDMERTGLDRDLPEIRPLAEGIEVRPVTADHLRAIWQADIEAFRDHWGGHDESEESFQRHLDSPEFDPSLWVVAWDGDEVVAGSLNSIYAQENEAIGRRRGWLDNVFTRRAWRKRGIAGGLIARSLHVLAQRGMDTAALGVDADNPSGALRLYESYGFAVTERGQAWRRPMEEASSD
ncbi:MAG TPA: GNAT family N-acetyltransferase [Methylomirabilota bacterium]|nr:GNAT family N-acetyltransferase [Methylomirabilota bacterium]